VVRESEEGKTARALAAASKKAGGGSSIRRKKGTPAADSVVGEGERSISVATRSQTKRQEANDRAILAGSGTPPNVGNPIPTSSVLGRAHYLVFESLLPHGATLEKTDSSLLDVENARVEVQSILTRERSDLGQLASYVRDRRRMGRSLLARLDREIAARSGTVFEALSDSTNEEAVGEDEDEEEEGEEIGEDDAEEDEEEVGDAGGDGEVSSDVAAE
jgi:hypothetical protein